MADNSMKETKGVGVTALGAVGVAAASLIGGPLGLIVGIGGLITFFYVGPRVGGMPSPWHWKTKKDGPPTDDPKICQTDHPAAPIRDRAEMQISPDGRLYRVLGRHGPLTEWMDQSTARTVLESHHRVEAALRGESTSC